MKKLLLTMALFLSIGAIQGQGIGALYQSTFVGTDNIIRFDPATNFHITCSQQATNDAHFFYTDMTTITEFLVITNITVEDFEIIDRYVYFCGHENVTSGVIGWFNIDSLIFLGGTAHVDNTLLALGLQTLENIEVFSDQGGFTHIAGYGIGSLPIPSMCTHMSIAFEAVGSPTSGMYYRTLPLAKNSCLSSIVDMTVTNNYVVYLEEVRNETCNEHSGIGITLQPFPKYYMFTPYHHPYFYFETTTNHIGYATNTALPIAYVVPDNDDPCIASPRITHIFEDEVAVCSYRSDFDPSSWQGDTALPCGGSLTRINTQLALRTYDLTPMHDNNPILMTAAAAAYLTTLNGSGSIDGFEFNAESEHFLVLHRHKRDIFFFESGLSAIDFSSHTFPLTIPTYYQYAIDTRLYWMPYSLCLTVGNEYTLGGAFFAGNDEYMFWHDVIPTTHPVSCDQQIDFMMKPIPTMETKGEYNTSTPTPWNSLSFWEVPPADMTSESCNILCE